ncbi:MAG: asparaginase domain-containing protein [Rickettsiales bacterium]|nr:asparaginase domain-containing protein [Rickettsiales bacterium]
MGYGVVVTGGTVLCAENGEGLNVPIYDDWHIQQLLTILKYKSELDSEYESLKTQILETKHILFQPESEQKRVNLENTKRTIHKNILGTIINKLPPSDEALLHFIRNMASLQGSGQDVVSPYIIDSIKFDFNEHYYRLLESAKEQLSKNDSVVIVGGTDTIQYYATALTKHLKASSSLSGNKKIFFLSSMGNLENHAEHNAKLFEIAGNLTKDNNVPGGGGYILSSADRDAREVIVHDATNSFVKVSARLHNSFRSLCPVGIYGKNGFEKNKNYIPPNAFLEYVGGGIDDSSPVLNRIAPPLLQANGQDEVIAYLDAVAIIKPPVNAAVIEINPKWIIQRGDGKFDEIKSKIKGLKKAGIDVILNNYYIYKNNGDTIEPKYQKQDLDKNNFLEQLLKEGAIYDEKTTKGCAVNALIRNNIQTYQNGFNMENSNNKNLVLSIGYFPDQELFIQFCKELKNRGVVGVSISGLPGSVLPEKVVNSLENIFGENNFNISFAGNENLYPDPENKGKTFTEGEGVNKAHYAEGAKAAKYASPLSPENAVKELRDRLLKNRTR